MRAMLREWAGTSALGDRMRIYHALGHFAPEEREELEDLCFGSLQEALYASVLGAVDGSGGDAGADARVRRIRTDEVDLRLPLRVNWGGGWTDTPPYCIENGGTVLNAAVLVRGRRPVVVRVRRLAERKVVFESEDSGDHGEFFDLADLRDCRDPFDPFALHKAALLACGIVSREGGGTLAEVLDALGGGLFLSTCVHGIPRGSGLGTSSILAGGCVKALHAFLGEDPPDGRVFDEVLLLEQIMSTGGGWQDQVGGLTPGVKLATSAPGERQEIRVKPVVLPEAAREEMERRFCLVYTGQRRLARHLLREVMGRYLASNPVSLRVLDAIRHVAVRMEAALLAGDVQGFAGLLDEHWELSKQLDPSCTNAGIEEILRVSADLLDGRMICGAGGGGFLQVVLREGATVEALGERLRAAFGEAGVDAWACSVAYGG
jgi:fucokinase